MDSSTVTTFRTVRLDQAQAFGLLTAYCVVYVCPLYVSATTRPSPTRSRDAPDTIRRRIRAVSLSTIACSIITILLLHHLCDGDGDIAAAARASWPNPLRLMGYWPVGIVDAAKATVLTALLFAGPLYECLLIDGAWRQWLSRLQPLHMVWTDWPTWRNMVAGPVTEECLFRSAAVPLLLIAGTSLTRIIFLSPLVFGLAHLHHFYEFRITHSQTPLFAAIARSFLQLSYTYIFGTYATFLYLRTGSLLAVILVHTLCNTIGLPRVWGLVEPYWLPISKQPQQRHAAIIWTFLYYALLLGGSFAWWWNLYTLTQSPMALAVF